MKKEIIICDKCGREIPKGEKYVQRPTYLHSNQGSGLEDICRDCAMQKINKNFWRNEVRTP